jgi:hypothetical protein
MFDRLAFDEQLIRIGLICVICVVLAVIAGLIARIFVARPEWRGRELEALAVELGLQFSAEGSPQMLLHFERLGMRMSGLAAEPADECRMRALHRYSLPEDVIYGQIKERWVLAFDTWRPTAEARRAADGREGDMSVLVMMGSWDVPHLVIRRERWDDRLAAALAIEDVDFESSKEFSDKFYVYCQEPAFAREAVTPQVMEHLLANPGWFIEVCGSDALIYDLNIWKPERFKEALAVLSGFLDRAPGFAPKGPVEQSEAECFSGTGG